MQYDMELIGKRIKAARKAKRYTQEYVSTRANIGVKFLSQIECGEAAWNKDWGGVVLPVLLCLSFVVSGSDEQQPGTRLEEIKVIRKGAAQ